MMLHFAMSGSILWRFQLTRIRTESLSVVALLITDGTGLSLPVPMFEARYVLVRQALNRDWLARYVHQPPSGRGEGWGGRRSKLDVIETHRACIRVRVER